MPSPFHDGTPGLPWHPLTGVSSHFCCDFPVVMHCLNSSFLITTSSSPEDKALPRTLFWSRFSKVSLWRTERKYNFHLYLFLNFISLKMFILYAFKKMMYIWCFVWRCSIECLYNYIKINAHILRKVLMLFIFGLSRVAQLKYIVYWNN